MSAGRKLSSMEGCQVPDVIFHTRKDDQWVDVTSQSIFKGRTVIAFAVPGAFTPTCSSSHVPKYNELTPVFRDNGIDLIVCISVNDGIVMQEWQKDQQAFDITFLPDGNGEFTEGMGMLVDKPVERFGLRSWRYSMLVEDGIVKRQFIEPDEAGDPFKVSDADTMLQLIAPKAERPDLVTVFTRVGCHHCVRAKQLLMESKMPFEEIELTQSVTSKSLRAICGKGTTPQIFMNGERLRDVDHLEWTLRGRK
eukprot:NODE_1377_length_942_cov_235.305711_g1060_i0.p1 GENE.NODE_1377_length_942_cov_235.305711_g1060_i0~~NODE_1377_length_942_cov_235.305711_g1060_i0.p1  ORF type:complete len:274 (+),score=56.26 NODE_1377_length_942_cov_235.305711_g1060_i0:72-824(+)